MAWNSFAGRTRSNFTKYGIWVGHLKGYKLLEYLFIFLWIEKFVSISLIYDTLVLVAPFLKYGIKCEIVAKVFTFNFIVKREAVKT